MLDLHIGSTSEHVRLRLPRQTAAEGWYQADVEIAVQGFTGHISAFFDAADFVQFQKGLQTLYSSLTGVAELKPMENQVVLSLKGNGRGGVTVEGHAVSQACWQNKLEFGFEIDQTFLVEPLAQLEAITMAQSKSNVGA